MNIISRYSDIPGLMIDESKIPLEIRHLMPLAVEWNITDYLELEAYINAASERKRRHFVESFAPHFEFITYWIKQSTHLMPLPDEVAIFDFAASAALRVRKTLFVLETGSVHADLLDFRQESELAEAS